MPDRIVIGQRVSPGKVQRAKDLRRDMTPSERLLWAELRTGKLNGLHFRRQQIIDGFIADFYCHAASLVIELDGSSHHDRADYDTERDLVIAARGLRILRIPNDEVYRDLRGVLARIAAACGT